MNARRIALLLQRPRRARPLFSGGADLRLLRVPNGDVRLRVSGSGSDVVVLVCEAPVFIEHYDALIARLVERYRVVCMLAKSTSEAGAGWRRPISGS